MEFRVFSFVLLSLCSGCAGVRFNLCSNHHFYIDKSTNHLTNVEMGEGGIVNCKDYGRMSTLQAMYIKLPHNCVTEVNDKGLEEVMQMCPKVEKDRLISSLILDRFPKIRFNIFPGTNWCGAGNIASGEEDFGFFKRLDSCCKTHDHCPEGIPKGESKYGLKNTNFGTISHCNCDEDFYDCLADVKHFAADNVGFTFFNILTMQCFKKDYPVVKCLKKEGLANNLCQEYEQDTTQEKTWQLFDPKIYRGSGIKGTISDAILSVD